MEPGTFEEWLRVYSEAKPFDPIKNVALRVMAQAGCGDGTHAQWSAAYKGSGFLDPLKNLALKKLSGSSRSK